MPPPLTLTGARRAILRSLYVAVFSASITALVMCVLPGHQTLYGVSVQVEPAGGPLLALAMIATTILAAIGLAMPRREITVLAAGTFTVLAIPIVIWVALSSLGTSPGFETHTLWPARVLDLALPIVAFSGPALAALSALLFRLEAHATVSTIPVATLR